VGPGWRYGALIASSGFVGFIVVVPQIAPQVLNAGIPEFFILAGVPFLYLTYTALPVTLAIGVLRQSLRDVDSIHSRTIVYVGVSGILAGMYTAGIKLMQTIFVAFIGNESDAVLIFTTLAVASVFTPIKNTLQSTVDRRFKGHEEPRHVLQEFDSSLQSMLDVVDPTQIPSRLLDKAAIALRAKSGALYMIEQGEARQVHTYGDWLEDEAMWMPISVEGIQLSWLALGPSQSGKVYDEQDRRILEGCALRVARMLTLARQTQGAVLSNVAFE
jgi:hypothetical protein